MIRNLIYVLLVLLVCSCGLDEFEVPSAEESSIEFTSSKMRIITKSGDQAQTFDDGTAFSLFAVRSGTDWNSAGTKMYNISGTGDSSGNIDYSIDGTGKKASYDVGQNLDFYGVTLGTPSTVGVSGSPGEAPVVLLALDASGRFPDLMYSDNLKNKNSSSGLLNMEFRHALAKLKFEVMKQDESGDSDKKLENAVLKKVVLKGSAAEADFNVKTGKWSVADGGLHDRTVYENAEGLKVEAVAHYLADGTSPIEMLVVPNVGDLSLEVTLDVDGSGTEYGDVVIDYTLEAAESVPLKVEANHEYTLSIVVLKNDVRIVTVTPKVYDWIDVDMGDVAYLGQPVYFGGLMWMDRNLGAKSADCENDWYNSIGYYYQFGRNIPYILDVDYFLSNFNNKLSFSFSLLEGEDGNRDAIYDMRAIYTYRENGNIVKTAKYANRTDGSCLYDRVAKTPGDKDMEYSYIMGVSTESTPRTWAITSFTDINDTKNENQIYWQNGDVLNVDNQPCPKGWRLPTKNDLYSFMPEDNKLLWEQKYVVGEDMRNPVVLDDETLTPKYKDSEDKNNKGKWNYRWTYFSGKFDVANVDKSVDFSSPVANADYARVYGIKFTGEQKAYRVMFEQRSNSDGTRKYVRIYRYDTYQTDEFKVSDDGTQWNLHKFDWSTPAEYMDIPLSGFMHNGGFTEFGKGAILRASTPSQTRGNNWTLYFRSGSNGVCVTDNTRRNLGENIRCVRDINAK